MPPQPRQIQTLLLDADGVIQTTPRAFIDDLKALCPDATQSRAFLEDIFTAEKPCLSGNLDFPDELEKVLRKWNVDVATSDALQLWNQIEPVAGALEFVARIRARGIRVCLATNQQAHRGSIMAERLAYASVFDHLFFSFELGVAKPSPAFFHAILDRLSASPDGILFIDDHAQNIEAAEGTGIAGETYHVNEGLDRFTSILEHHGLIV